ncbi:MAG TPA: universal stress protein [Deltaproteobacteria bacterium]|nr:universal stress protein [Deltaproteobacteria bacterium]HPR56390.1 universal stress protein [Deltaproteobacteria bacterium]
MFSKILYPTDFSEVSGKASGFVERLQEAGTRDIVLLHVIDTRHFPMIETIESKTVMKTIEEKLEKESMEKLNQIAEHLRARGLGVKVLLKKGVPFQEILSTAEEEDVSVIVVGSHGISNVGEMLLGSVSEKVIRKSKKTVIVVKR